MEKWKIKTNTTTEHIQKKRTYINETIKIEMEMEMEMSENEEISIWWNM